MFKRVAKRVKRKEDEEALGLDEDMKEALGMHDTDSDESESDSSGDESNSEAGSDAVSISGEDADAGDMLSGEEVTDQDREAESSDDEAQEAPMILEEALRDPIYLVSLDPEVKACITCPGKLLKNAKMSDIHLSSQAHKRRYTKFVELAQGQEDIADVLDALEAESGSKPSIQNDGSSKRAQKRKAKMEAVKVKRARQKAMKAKALMKKEQKAVAESSEEGKPAIESSAPLPKTAKKARVPKDSAKTSSPASPTVVKKKKRSEPDTARDAPTPATKRPRKEAKQIISSSAKLSAATPSMTVNLPKGSTSSKTSSPKTRSSVRPPSALSKKQKAAR